MNPRTQAVLVSIAIMLLLGLGMVAANHLVPLPTTTSYWLGILLIAIGIGCIALRVPVHPRFYLLQMVGTGSQPASKNVVRDGVLLSLAGMALVGLYYGDQYYNSYMAQFRFATAFTQGIEASKVRDWSTAVDAFSEATKWDALSAKAHFNLGLMQLHKMDNEDAIVSFGEAIRLDPNYAKAYRARGVAYERIGNKAQAEEDLKKAVSLDPHLDPGLDGPAT